MVLGSKGRDMLRYIGHRVLTHRRRDMLRYVDTVWLPPTRRATTQQPYRGSRLDSASEASWYDVYPNRCLSCFLVTHGPRRMPNLRSSREGLRLLCPDAWWGYARARWGWSECARAQSLARTAEIGHSARAMGHKKAIQKPIGVHIVPRSLRCTAESSTTARLLCDDHPQEPQHCH